MTPQQRMEAEHDRAARCVTQYDINRDTWNKRFDVRLVLP